MVFVLQVYGKVGIFKRVPMGCGGSKTEPQGSPRKQQVTKTNHYMQNGNYNSKDSDQSVHWRKCLCSLEDNWL